VFGQSFSFRELNRRPLTECSSAGRFQKKKIKPTFAMPDHPSIVQIAERLTATAVIIKPPDHLQGGTAFFEYSFSASAKRSSENLFGDSDYYRQNLYRKNCTN